jgi:quercetin dioxygenase-like cupin family protein
MIRRRTEVEAQPKEAIRGGSGRAVQREYVRPGEMPGVGFVSVLTLEPGAVIGEHLHPSNEELYLLIEGAGVGVLDGEAFDVGPGDAWLCKAGHTHGLRNGPSGPLTFVAVLSEPPK